MEKPSTQQFGLGREATKRVKSRIERELGIRSLLLTQLHALVLRKGDFQRGAPRARQAF
jgi:hypothetical protein